MLSLPSQITNVFRTVNVSYYKVSLTVLLAPNGAKWL